MYARILIATDGSALADQGLEQGLGLAKALGSEVTILTVSEPWTPLGADATGFASTEFAFYDQFEQEAEKFANAILADAAEAARKAGVKHKTVYIPRKHPADAIVDYVAANSIDLVVMASHGRRGVERVLLGSQTAEVATRSKVPVLVIR